jgi:hypothetical protein
MREIFPFSNLLPSNIKIRFLYHRMNFYIDYYMYSYAIYDAAQIRANIALHKIAFKVDERDISSILASRLATALRDWRSERKIKMSWDRKIFCFKPSVLSVKKLSGKKKTQKQWIIGKSSKMNLIFHNVDFVGFIMWGLVLKTILWWKAFWGFQESSRSF